MKNFCLDLREHATKIINYEKKEMIPLTKKEEKIHNKQKLCYICDICNLIYKIQKEIPVVFHNGSTYDYHFIMKELAEEFEGQFECLGENTEKYITFSVPIKKEVSKIDKDGNDKIMKISYKKKFIDSFILLIIYLKNFIVINAQTVNRFLTI